MHFQIKPVNRSLEAQLREKIDQKTKPIGALGRLETLALQIGLLQNTLNPLLKQPAIVVCAADHGAAADGVSAYPAEVTAQMVLNFLRGGAAINVFAQQNDIGLKIVDAGVDYDFSSTADSGLIDAKVARGTRNYRIEAAMTPEQCQQAMANGAALVEQLQRDGCNIVGFGEMGIGNTASASLLMSLLCDLPLPHCTGAGTGLDEAGIAHKVQILEQARQRILQVHGGNTDPLTLLSEAGGFEIATICGGMLRAAELGMIIIVDGFITTSALLVARAFDAHVLDYCIFSHCSDEAGHELMLQQLDAKPLLDLRLRLGEGTGAALVWPLIQAAVAFLNDMASFSSAGVSGKQSG